MTTDDIRVRIEAALPGAHVVVLDEADDGAHFVAEVTWSGFAGMNRIAQHRAVYAALPGLVGHEIHALALTTRVAG